VKLVVFRRHILESSLGAEECGDRLRQAMHRVQHPFVWRPLVGWASRDAFSVRSGNLGSWLRWGVLLLMPRANGRFVSVPDPATEIRVELGVSIIELMVVIFFAAFLLLGALTPGYLASDLILGAIFLFWVAWHGLALLRWNRRADRLVQVLSSTCDAAVQEE
jgi:hypothetical protein